MSFPKSSQGARFSFLPGAVTALALLVATACGSDEALSSKTPPARDAGGSGATGGAGGNGGGCPGTGTGGTGTGGTAPPIGPGTGPVDAAMPPADGACAAVTQEAETKKQPADIIWIVDNSGSMTTEAQAVQDNMNVFAQQITASGIDVRVILISSPQTIILGIPIGNGVCVGAPLGSGQCPNDSLAPRYLHLPNAVGSWDALNLLITNYPQYKSMLRAGASKTFVVVTDDNAIAAPNNSAAAFTSAVTALDPMMFAKWTLSGVYCQMPCLNCSAVGSVYEDLRKQTGGVSGDMCLTDFAPVFKELAKAVITGSKLSCEWTIPPPPAGEMFDPGKVNVIYTPDGQAPRDLFNVPSAADCGMLGGWFYDDNTKPTKILACPITCSEIQADLKAKIAVAFGCKTKIIVK